MGPPRLPRVLMKALDTPKRLNFCYVLLFVVAVPIYKGPYLHSLQHDHPFIHSKLFRSRHLLYSANFMRKQDSCVREITASVLGAEFVL